MYYHGHHHSVVKNRMNSKIHSQTCP
jgi:hypothetical protein